jgi:hypothetical protein
VTDVQPLAHRIVRRGALAALVALVAAIGCTPIGTGSAGVPKLPLGSRFDLTAYSVSGTTASGQ